MISYNINVLLLLLLIIIIIIKLIILEDAPREAEEGPAAPGTV